MDSALPVEPDYKRKPNFTDMEKLYLLQQYSLFKPVLSSKLCDSVTTRQKQDTWQIIANGLNQQNPTVDRTAKEVKKKWENLATLARKEINEFRQGSGRSLLRPPSALTLKILELLDDISFNPALTCDTSYGAVKEEVWDDDTGGSAEMSPGVSNGAASRLGDVPPLPSLTYGLLGRQQRLAASPADSRIGDLSPVSSGHALSRPPPPPVPPTADRILSRDSEQFCAKRRRENLETERLELENEKLRLETEILREKLKILKETHRLGTTEEADR